MFTPSNGLRVVEAGAVPPPPPAAGAAAKFTPANGLDAVGPAADDDRLPAPGRRALTILRDAIAAGSETHAFVPAGFSSASSGLSAVTLRQLSWSSSTSAARFLRGWEDILLSVPS